MRLLAGGGSLDGERMNAAGKLGSQSLIDHAVTVEPAFAFEGVRHDADAEMGFTTFPPAGMAVMLVRFIDHPELLRGESLGKLF